MSAGASEVLLQMPHVIAFASHVHFLLIKGQSDQMSKDPKMLPAFKGGKAWKRALCTAACSMFSLELAFQVPGGALCAQRKSSDACIKKNIEHG